MNDIKIVKLVDGLEVLAKVTLKDEEVILENPTHIMCGPNPKTGQMDVHMSPMVPLAAVKTVTINSRQILFMYDPVVEIINKYNTLFGSNLILPEGGIVTS